MRWTFRGEQTVAMRSHNLHLFFTLVFYTTSYTYILHVLFTHYFLHLHFTLFYYFFYNTSYTYVLHFFFTTFFTIQPTLTFYTCCLPLFTHLLPTHTCYTYTLALHHAHTIYTIYYAEQVVTSLLDFCVCTKYISAGTRCT